MCCSSANLNSVHFANDSTIYVQSDNISNLTDVLTVELEKVYIWLCSNKKFDVPLLIVNYKPGSFVDIIIFLGVIIEKRPNFE